VSSARETAETIATCREAGLNVHIDGARVWNAAVAEGVPPRDLLQGADTAMVTLSKGLCAPVGSLLLCSARLYPRARRVRQQLGGGLRQAGILAAAGLVGLETMVSRLAEDHANAQILARRLALAPRVRVLPARTNIVVGRMEGDRAVEVAAALAARGVRASAMDASTLRLVTHNDVSRADCERAADALAAVLS
jgi:threonine aldolase